jgi:hypothetical protein
LGTAPSGPGAATLVSLKIEARRSRRLNRIENKMRKTKRAAFSTRFLCILCGASQKIREKMFFFLNNNKTNIPFFLESRKTVAYSEQLWLDWLYIRKI